jgi:hypothetical protein
MLKEHIQTSTRTTQMDEVVRELARGQISSQQAVERLRNHIEASRRRLSLKERLIAFLTVLRWQSTREL